MVPKYLANRVLGLLILGALSLATVNGIQFNYDQDDVAEFDMVVGNDNTTSGTFNETICSVKAGTLMECEYWPPPSLTTGQYIMRVYDSSHFALSPVFNVANYGNVSATAVPPWAEPLPTSTPTQTPDDSQPDDGNTDTDPDPHNLEMWIPLSFGIFCAVGGVIFAIFAARKQVKDREMALRGNYTGRPVKPWPGVAEGDADLHVTDAASSEHHGLLGHFSRGSAAASGLRTTGAGGNAAQQSKKTLLGGRLAVVFFGKPHVAKTIPDAKGEREFV